jgi:hypothetical protein
MGWQILEALVLLAMTLGNYLDLESDEVGKSKKSVVSLAAQAVLMTAAFVLLLNVLVHFGPKLRFSGGYADDNATPRASYGEIE